MSFFMRTSINRKFLELRGDTDGSLSVRSQTVNGDTTITFSSSDDLTVNARGNLNATIRGGDENDTFNFLNATGNYNFQTRGGNDTVTDGIGDNTFDGGAGLDTFNFAAETAPTSPPDRIRVETDTINNYVVADDDINATGVQSVADTATNQVTITLVDGDKIIVNGTGVNAGAITGELA